MLIMNSEESSHIDDDGCSDSDSDHDKDGGDEL